MRRPGPKKTPTNVLKLRGSWLGKAREKEAKMTQLHQKTIGNRGKSGEIPEPPAHLSGRVKKWFRTMLESYSFTDAELRLFVLGCEAHDRCTSAREAIEASGLTYLDRFGQPRPRPEVGIELASRAAFSRIMHQLSLDESESP